MSPQMILTMIVLAFVVVLFIFEWVRVDVVGIIMMVLLPMIGLITPKEAFVGLSSNAVCSIIAVIIIGAGLDKTGVMNHVARPIIRLAGSSEKAGHHADLRHRGHHLEHDAEHRCGGAVSAGGPADFKAHGDPHLPGADAHGVLRHHRRDDHPGRRKPHHPPERPDGRRRVTKLQPFGLFTQTPIGIALLIAAILYFVIFGRLVLPSGKRRIGQGRHRQP